MLQAAAIRLGAERFRLSALSRIRKTAYPPNKSVLEERESRRACWPFWQSKKQNAAFPSGKGMGCVTTALAQECPGSSLAGERASRPSPCGQRSEHECAQGEKGSSVVGPQNPGPPLSYDSLERMWGPQKNRGERAYISQRFTSHSTRQAYYVPGTETNTRAQRGRTWCPSSGEQCRRDSCDT